MSEPTPNPASTVYVIIHLNARLQPRHRHERYEDPIDAAFGERVPGTCVVGGGTAMEHDGEPSSCDIEVELPAHAVDEVPTLLGMLEALGAPRGSWATVDEGERTYFGATEGLALYLNGTELPDEVYENSDNNALVGDLLESLQEEGDLQSWWEGPQDTALYFYGASEERMRERITAVLPRHPQTQLSRLVAIT